MIPSTEEYKVLNKELSLGNYDDQDWELCVADSERVAEFIKFYKERNLSDLLKVAVMELIVASYDRHLESNPSEVKLWESIKDLLSVNKELHWYTIFYWSCESDGKELTEGFEVTERMRQLHGL